MRVWVGKLPLNYIWGLYTLIILLLLRNYCSSSWLPSSWSRSSSSSKFIRIRSNRFYVDGSSNFLFTGFNSFWLMNVAADPTRKHKVSEVFREAATAGLTVCRTWAFSDGGPAALQISPGVYDQHMFQALDFVISEADKYKIRLILSLSNNYKDFGGRPQYVNWAREAGFAVSSDDDFYTDEIIKGYYKSHVRTVLTRINTVTGVAYKDDPTIMAWELINEPRCQADSSGRTVNEWVKEMASFVKSIDRKHLLEIGLEGFYGDSVPERKQYNPNWETSGTDFIRDNLIKEIDFATIHAYPDIWLPGQDEESHVAFMERWVRGHWEDLRTILKKPLVFTEFGRSNVNTGSLGERDSFLNATYASIYLCARRGGMGGGLLWQLMAQGMEPYDDGYAVVLSQHNSTTALIRQHYLQMRALEFQITKIRTVDPYPSSH